MELSVAREIIEQQSRLVVNSEDYWSEDAVITTDSNGSHNLEEFFRSSKEDTTIDGVYVYHVDQHGGEDMGSEYYLVFEIDSPEHGRGFIKYSGYYDSWNGVDWDEGNYPVMVEKVQVMRDVWKDVQ